MSAWHTRSDRRSRRRWSSRSVEWIAHELEHVVEQLDGLSLPALAADRQGAWLSAEKMFETMRAIDAGRRVVAEMQQAARRARRRSHIFVE